MMFLLFFSIAAVLMVVLILKFDKKQAIKVNKILKETSDVPQLFLIKSTEQKVLALKTVLRYDETLKNMALETPGPDEPNESSRISKILELKQLLTKYNDGQISLEVYNAALDKLIELV